MTIKLNDILQIEDLNNTKIRFLMNDEHHPIEQFESKDDKLLDGHYWNYKSKSYKIGQKTFGFIKIKANEDLWLLHHASEITKVLNIMDGPGYEYNILRQYEKYFGRLIIKYKNTATQLIQYASTVIDKCEIYKILPDIFDNDIFPGYDKVNISWEDLSRVLQKGNWRTALENQKGVYLITDISNGKRYVGSAYGKDMLLGRWEDYKETGHGGNKDLKGLPLAHIKANFRYSILDIFKSTTEDDVIREREGWWKEVLLSRKFGYNKN